MEYLFESFNLSSVLYPISVLLITYKIFGILTIVQKFLGKIYGVKENGNNYAKVFLIETEVNGKTSYSLEFKENNELIRKIFENFRVVPKNKEDINFKSLGQEFIRNGEPGKIFNSFLDTFAKIMTPTEYELKEHEKMEKSQKSLIDEIKED